MEHAVRWQYRSRHVAYPIAGSTRWASTATLFTQATGPAPRLCARHGAACALVDFWSWCLLLGMEHFSDATQGHIVPEDAETSDRAAAYTGNL
jgi:hypothetical protein